MCQEHATAEALLLTGDLRSCPPLEHQLHSVPGCVWVFDELGLRVLPSSDETPAHKTNGNGVLARCGVERIAL